MNRRELLRCGGALIPAFTAISGRAQAAAFPDRAIRLLAASAPGTLVDQAARLYAERMGAYFKQPVVVDNVAGASTSVAARQVIRSAADGYTLMAAANTVVVAPMIIRNAGYGVKDFSAIGELARAPGMLVVSAASPYKSLRDLVTAARANPGAISFGSSGVGSTNHLPVELFARQAGVNFTHVPYKGISLALPDVVAGRVGFMMATATSISGMIANGALRPLAISSETRSPAFPKVPTFQEQGYSEGTSAVWIGLLGPAGLPPAVLASLAQALAAARADANLLKRLAAAGQSVSDVRTPEQFAAELRQEEARVQRIVKEKNLVLE